MLILAVALLATPDFPGVIQQQLALSQPPRCTICHASEAGGTGTVIKPFGVYLVSRGLRPGDEDSLRNALFADIGEMHSSDGGKTSDVAALTAGDDPNGDARPLPQYGCSSGSAGAGATALLLLMAIRPRTAGRRRWLRRLRRRRRWPAMSSPGPLSAPTRAGGPRG